MVELPLEVIVDACTREFGVRCERRSPASSTTRPCLAPREAKAVRPARRAARAISVVLHQHRSVPRRGLRVRQPDPGGSVPSDYIPAVIEGIDEALETASGRYPMVDLKVTLTDCSTTTSPSSRSPSKWPARLAIKEAAKLARRAARAISRRGGHARDFLGRLIGDLSRRRGASKASERRATPGGSPRRCPLIGCSYTRRDLRSHTQGRATTRCSSSPTMFRRHRREGLGTAHRRAGPPMPGCPRQSARPAQPVTELTPLDDFPVRPHRAATYQDESEDIKLGEGEIRARQAARQRRDHRSHRPWHTDADRCHHLCAGGAGRREPGLRENRQRAREKERGIRSLTSLRVPDENPTARPSDCPGPADYVQET